MAISASASNAETTPVALIGFAEALAAPEAAWSLVDAGYRVIAFTRRAAKPALRASRLVETMPVTAPEEDLEACVRQVQDLAARLHASVVMPLDDAALSICDRAYTKGQTPWLLAGASGRLAEVALDKRLQVLAADSAGLSVPETSSHTPGEPVPQPSTFPVIVKPALAVRQSGRGLGKGSAAIAQDQDELETLLKNQHEPMLVQQVVHGAGEGVFGIVTEGGVCAWSGHRRVRMMNPAGSGSSACRATDPDPAHLARCEAMLRSIDWRGLFMLEFIRDADGRNWFMELNGRTWGSMALARRHGLEYPAWAAALAVDPGFRPPNPRHAKRPNTLTRHLGREIVHLMYAARGPTQPSPHPWPGRLEALKDFLLGERGQSWYNWRRDDRAVFWADTKQTVLSQFRKRGKSTARKPNP